MSAELTSKWFLFIWSFPFAEFQNGFGSLTCGGRESCTIICWHGSSPMTPEKCSGGVFAGEFFVLSWNNTSPGLNSNFVPSVVFTYLSVRVMEQRWSGIIGWWWAKKDQDFKVAWAIQKLFSSTRTTKVLQLNHVSSFCGAILSEKYWQASIDQHATRVCGWSRAINQSPEARKTLIEQEGVCTVVVAEL